MEARTACRLRLDHPGWLDDLPQRAIAVHWAHLDATARTDNQYDVRVFPSGGGWRLEAAGQARSGAQVAGGRALFFVADTQVKRWADEDVRACRAQMDGQVGGGCVWRHEPAGAV